MSGNNALQAAESLFASYRGPGSRARGIGEEAIRVLLLNRNGADLSAAETHALLKAYNWASRNTDGLELAKKAVQRWGDEFLQDLDTALHNSSYWPKGAYVAAADELIREGIGPAVHWYLRKADWWVSEATGEHDSEVAWYPGDRIADQTALDLAAVELDAAIRHSSSSSRLPDSSWRERYAPLLQEPRFDRFKPADAKA